MSENMRDALSGMLNDDTLRGAAERYVRKEHAKAAEQKNEAAHNAFLFFPIAAPNERGAAEVFAEKNEHTIRYVPGQGWYVWDGQVWITGKRAETIVKGKMSEYMKNSWAEALAADLGKWDKKAQAWVDRMQTDRAAKSVLGLVETMLTSSVDEFDADPWALNTPGGIVDLRTGEIRPHDPDARCTMICGCAPGPSFADQVAEASAGESDSDDDPFWLRDAEEAELTDWQQFLKTVTCGNAELERYIQVIFGMAAVGKVYQEGIAIFYGGGSNGKSTLCNPVAGVLGSYAGRIAPEVLMAKRNDDEAKGLAAVRGRRLVLASESDSGQRLSASIVKRLASTDKMIARELYHDAVEFEPSHTLILFTNFLPRVSDADYGIWRRINAVPFNAKMGAASGQKPIQNYGAKLEAESGPEILRWIIDGAVAFCQNGCCLPEPPQVVQDATEEYKNGEDWVHQFVEDCCLEGAQYTIQYQSLRKAYMSWASFNMASGRSFSRTQMLKAFSNSGYLVVSGGSGRPTVIQGLRLTSDTVNSLGGDWGANRYHDV